MISRPGRWPASKWSQPSVLSSHSPQSQTMQGDSSAISGRPAVCCTTCPPAALTRSLTASEVAGVVAATVTWGRRCVLPASPDGPEGCQRSSRRAVMGNPRLPGRPLANSASQYRRRAEKSCQGTGNTPGNVGPLRRWPSARQEATLTMRASGQRRDNAMTSANRMSPGRVSARQTMVGASVASSGGGRSIAVATSGTCRSGSTAAESEAASWNSSVAWRSPIHSRL